MSDEDDWEADADALIADEKPADSKKINDEEEIDSEEEREKEKKAHKDKME